MKVLESASCDILLIITDTLEIGDKVLVIEGRKNFVFKKSISVVRYITAIRETEAITTDEFISSVTLSSQPLTF